jgi:hypothetical protein
LSVEIVRRGGIPSPPLWCLGLALRLGYPVMRVPTLCGPSATVISGVIYIAEPACLRWSRFVVAHELAHLVNDNTHLILPRCGAWYEHQIDATAICLMTMLGRLI